MPLPRLLRSFIVITYNLKKGFEFMKAMILAAGKGTRVQPITHVIPKPMIPILQKPVMEFLLELLREHNFKEIMVNVSHLAEEIENYFRDGQRFGVEIAYSFEGRIEDGDLIGDAFFAFPPSFAQGASQSIEGAYELFENIENNTKSNFFRNRVDKIKMVNNRSKFNQFAFHLSNPLTTFLRNIFLKRLVKNKKFLEGYLGKIYKN